eukprot:5006207-Prymnesium_polylepis.1
MQCGRLECDVDQAEEAQLRALEGLADEAETDGDGASWQYAADARGQAAVACTPLETENAVVTQARAALVTGYAEHRASLSEKKKYRRAIKIDLKLPEASTALVGVPRRKHFQDGEEGREAGRSLASCGLTPGATVHLAVRGRGGGCAQSKAARRSSTGTNAQQPEILGETERSRSRVRLGGASSCGQSRSIEEKEAAEKAKKNFEPAFRAVFVSGIPVSSGSESPGFWLVRHDRTVRLKGHNRTAHSPGCPCRHSAAWCRSSPTRGTAWTAYPPNPTTPAPLDSLPPSTHALMRAFR